MTYVEVPPKAAMLHSLEVPPPEAGGNTYFANMFAAYEALPADLKKAAAGKIAVHDASTNSAGMLRKGYKEVTDVQQTVGAHHPLIRTEPGTGRSGGARDCMPALCTDNCWLDRTGKLSRNQRLPIAARIFPTFALEADIEAPPPHGSAPRVLI